MKKSLSCTLFLLFTFCLSLQGFSQFNWGIQGGGNVSNFHSSQIEYLGGSQNRLGYHAGLLAEIPLGKKVFFQPSLLYSLKGWRSKPSAGFGQQGRVSFDYIDLPLLVGYRLSDKFSLLAGPQVGHLFRARAITEAMNINIGYQYKSLDAGIVGAVSYRFTPRLGMQVSYSLGLRRLNQVSIYNADGIQWRSFTTGNNRVLGVSAYYMLKTKR